jgi:hypothetical protein
MITVSTSDGMAYAGVLESETDKFLKMVQLDAKPVSIDKSLIVSRQSVHSSPMPPYDMVVSAKQLADLVSWLMSQRSL